MSRDINGAFHNGNYSEWSTRQVINYRRYRFEKEWSVYRCQWDARDQGPGPRSSTCRVICPARSNVSRWYTLSEYEARLQRASERSGILSLRRSRMETSSSMMPRNSSGDFLSRGRLLMRSGSALRATDVCSPVVGRYCNKRYDIGNEIQEHYWNLQHSPFSSREKNNASKKIIFLSHSFAMFITYILFICWLKYVVKKIAEWSLSSWHYETQKDYSC